MERTKFFAVAYAGGSAVGTFSKWALALGDAIEVVPLEYAGHGIRMSEPLSNSIEDTVSDLLATTVSQIKNGEPYVFYGHSMGCLVVYELLKKLDEIGMHPPGSVYLSSRMTPDVPVNTTLHQMSDEEFILEMRRVGGTPDGFFEIKMLVDAFLPILKNDYKLIEDYTIGVPMFKTQADIYFFLSDADTMVSENAASRWAEFTSGTFSISRYSGDHFFINDHYEDISQIIADSLSYEYRYMNA